MTTIDERAVLADTSDGVGRAGGEDDRTERRLNDAGDSALRTKAAQL